MKKLPLWKIKRELKRLGWQTANLIPNAWDYLSLRIRYDAFMANQIVRHRGRKPFTPEAAIYLIFPSKGVLKSHLQVLDELNRHNITPVVVTNLPLSKTELQKILEKSAIVIERPNVGYDFGGYRDGILEIENELSKLKRLYIMNDSVWMIDSKKSWFEDVRSLKVDFCGATSNYGIKRYTPEEFRNIEWTYTPNHIKFHYASYALAMTNRVLQDPHFFPYWKKLRLSNKKKKTVKRGEIAFSQWIKKRKFSHGATCDINTLDKEMSNLSAKELDALTRNLVIPESTKLLEKRDEVLRINPNSEQGMSDRRKIILTTVTQQAVGYVLPYYTLNHRGFQFLKKSPLWLSSDSASTSLRIMEDFTGPLGRQALLEAKIFLNENRKNSAQETN